MATGVDLVNAALRFVGEPYSNNEGRTSPWSGFKDCSGLVAAAFQVAAGYELGAYVTVTQYALAVDAGLAIPRDLADDVIGACYFIPDDPEQGYGNAGHVGFSLGNGYTVEATPPRVQVLPNRYQHWGARAALLPGIDYANNGWGAPAASPPPPKPKESDVEQFPHASLKGHTVGAVRGNDGNCYTAHRSPNGVWDDPGGGSKFFPTGDAISSWPTVGKDDERITVFMRGLDGNVYTKDWTPKGWGPTTLLGGPVPDATKLNA